MPAGSSEGGIAYGTSVRVCVCEAIAAEGEKASRRESWCVSEAALLIFYTFQTQEINLVRKTLFVE